MPQLTEARDSSHALRHRARRHVPRLRAARPRRASPRKLSELQGDDPLILTLARGHYCPKEHQQHLELAAFYPKIAVALHPGRHDRDRRAPHAAGVPRVGRRASGRSSPTRSGSSSRTSTSRSTPTPSNDPMIPHTLVLKPGLVVHSIYNGYWFWGRPSVDDLWHDLRARHARDPPRLGPQHAGAARGLGRRRLLALPRLGHGGRTRCLRACERRPRAGALRADRRRDRRQRRHRARDRPARPRRGRGRHPHGAESRAPGAGRRASSARGTAAFDANDSDALARFFDELPAPIDHVLVTGRRPVLRAARRDGLRRRRAGHRRALVVALAGRARTPPAGCGPEARCCSSAAPAAAARRRPRAHLGDHGRAAGAHREPRARARARSASTWSRPASSTRRCRRRSSATSSTQRRDQLRATLPIGRVVGPDDVAALAVHLMTNTALTGATYDVDGGQQLL